MHLYFKNDRLAMWSETPVYAPKFVHVEKILTPDEFEKVKGNYETRLKNDKIEQIQPPGWTEKQKEDRKNLMRNLKDDLQKAKSFQDALPILNTILTEIEKQ